MAYGRRPKYAPRRKASARKTKSTNYTGAMVLSALKGYALTKLKQKLGLNTETKFLDVAGTTTATTTLSTRIQSPTLAQGLTDSTRTGASVRITKVETRVSIVVPAAATTANVVRIIQVRYLRTGAPALADILDTTTDITSPLNDHHADLGVQILKDLSVPLGTATGGDGSAYVHWTHTGLADHMTWPDADTTGTPAACLKGAIYTYWMVDNVTTVPVFTSKSRYWFVDN